MKAKPNLKRFTVNETESELHFKKRNKRVEEVISLINASNHPQAIKMCLKCFKNKRSFLKLVETIMKAW